MRQCLRILFRIDALSAFVKSRFYTDHIAIPKEPISKYWTTKGTYLIKSMIATNSITVREYVSEANRFGNGMNKFDNIIDILRMFPTRYKTAEKIMDKLQSALIPADVKKSFAKMIQRFAQNVPTSRTELT